MFPNCCDDDGDEEEEEEEGRYSQAVPEDPRLSEGPCKPFARDPSVPGLWFSARSDMSCPHNVVWTT